MVDGQFIDVEDLNWDRAYRRILENSHSDFVPLKFESWLLRQNKQEYISRAKDVLSSINYNPAPLTIMEVPKPDLTTRPVAVAELDDRLIYQALVDTVAETVESQLQNEVLFSHRLVSDTNATRMFRDFDESYGAFLHKQKYICEVRCFKNVVVADVASYYERIYHHKLMTLLRGLGCKEPLVQTLGHLLREWNNGDSHGIPQGFWASDYLGNIYLHQVDVSMLMQGFSYLRYVDDIVVFCNTIAEGRRILLGLSKELRRLGLGLQGAKTDIISVEEHKAYIVPATERLEKAFKKIAAGVRLKLNPYFDEFTDEDLSEIKGEINTIAVHKVFNEVISSGKINETLLKSCLTFMAAAEDPYATDFVLAKMADLPHLTSYFGNYLCRCKFDAPIKQRIIDFLRLAENVYDWQAMWLIRYIGLENLCFKSRSLLRDIFSNRNHHDALRALCALILGSRGDIADQRMIKDSFEAETSELLKRAIICGLVSMVKAERNHFLKYHQHDSWSLRIACNTIFRS